MTTFNVQQDHVNSFYGGKQLFTIHCYVLKYYIHRLQRQAGYIKSHYYRL